MKGIDNIECAEELVNIFSRIGIPQEILSDRGSQFVSDLCVRFYDYCQSASFKRLHIMLSAMGFVERWKWGRLEG